MPPLLFFVQSLYDLINKILNEAGAAHAHDVYNNLYPANNGRLRPHKDRKQVLGNFLCFHTLTHCACFTICYFLQCATFKINIRFSTVASELLIWVRPVSHVYCV